MSSRTLHVLSAFLQVALLTTLSAGCGGDAPARPADSEAPRPTEIRVTHALDGASTALHVGQALRVELPANPSKGYAWELESVDESVLRVPVEEYQPPDAEGGAGTSSWSFLAIGAGTTTVKLKYVKFGEDVPTAERTFSFRVLVD